MENILEYAKNLLNEDGKYVLVLVKATRKPFVVKENLSFSEGMKLGDQMHRDSQILFKAGLAASGVAVSLVPQDQLEKVNALEIGGLSFQGVKESFIWGNH